MKRLALSLSLLLLLLLTPGCLSAGKLAKTINALGHDPASVHVRITSIYGVIEITRANPNATNTAPHSLTPDGKIEVKP